ncbi:hypothetical protein [Streptomyces sp. NPDC004376]
MSETPMTLERLAEIAARVEAATSGPWCTDDWEIYQGTEYEPGISLWVGETCTGTGTPERDRANATFAAAARTDVPDLLADNARLRARVAELEAQLSLICRECAGPVVWVTHENGGWWNHVSPSDNGHGVVPKPAEDPCRPCGCPKRFDRHAWGCPEAGGVE